MQYIANHYVLSLDSKKATLYHHLGQDITTLWTHENTDEALRDMKWKVLPSGKSGKHFNNSINGFRDKLAYMAEVSNRVLTSVPHELPVVLHANKKDAEIYRIVDRHPGLLKQRLSKDGIYGSLLDVREHSENVRAKLKQQFIDSALRTLVETSARARFGINEAVNALSRGQAKAVYVSRDKMRWGKIDWEKSRTVLYSQQQNAFDDDVLDDIAERGISQELPVYVVDSSQMPRGADVAVILNSKWIETALAPFPTQLERAFWRRFSPPLRLPWAA